MSGTELQSEQRLNAKRLGMTLEEYLKRYHDGELGQFSALTELPTQLQVSGVSPHERPGHLSPTKHGREHDSRRALETLRNTPTETEFQQD